jgi:trk system potassium uptake protein TrkA
VFVLVAGGGKLGSTLARGLIAMKHEVVLVECSRSRVDQLEAEFGHRIQHGDATELYVLERAGVKRPPDIIAAVTGDDEDNMVVCQLARERYNVPKAIARVNDPRNQEHFDLLGIAPTVSATRAVLALIEHEVPQHDLVHLLELRRENLEIVEIEIPDGAATAGKRVEDLRLPESARLISVMREGSAEIAVGSTELRAGDQVLAVLRPGAEDDLRAALLDRGGLAARLRG